VQSAIEKIGELVKDIPGWSPEDQLFALYMLAISTSHLRGDIWEIGSWCGRSSVVLAKALKDSGGGVLHCIDLFPEKNDWRKNADGTFSFTVTLSGKEYGGYELQTVWPDPYERDIAPLYEKHGASLERIFRKHVEASGHGDVVQHYRGVAPEYAKNYRGRLRFAFIDGDHSYESVCADIAAVERSLVEGGWMAFDDAYSSYEGVDRAIDECIVRSARYECCQQLTRKLFVARKV